EIKPSEITPESVYENRRTFLKAAVVAGLVPAAFRSEAAPLPPPGEDFQNVAKWPKSTDERVNSWKDITEYNNYYEFGTGKEDPMRYAHTLEPRPWSIQVTGEAAKTGTYTLEDILKPH